MKSELHINRAFYPPGYKSQYKLNLSSSAAFLSELTDFTLRELIPESVWNSAQLLDLKGRDPQEPRHLPASNVFHGSLPQLLLITGNFFICTEPEVENSEIMAVPFEVSLTSDFLAFKGFSHIEHQIIEHRSGELPSFLNTRDLAHVFPLEIKDLSLGMELFKPRRFSSLLAFTPTVTQSIQLEANRAEFNFSMDAHSLKSREEMPFTQDSTLLKLSNFLVQQTNFNLLNDYASKCGIS